VLTVNANPSSLSGQVTGGGSYSSGASASFSGASVVQVSKDTRYVFTGWSGDFSGSSVSGSVTMDAAKTVTAGYQLQYYLTVNVQPSSVPSVQRSGWYNAGDMVSFSVPSSQAVSVGDGARLVFSGWSVDGNSQGSTLNLQMNAPHVVTAQYKQQYYLKVLSDRGVSSGEGWYDGGSYAQFSVSTPSSPSFGVNLIFNGWQGDVQSASQSSRVLMDGPKTVTATWSTDATVLYATIAGVIIAIALIAVAAFYSSQRKRATTTTTLCSQCGKPFRPGTNYCVTCGTPRNKSNNANRAATTQSSATQPGASESTKETT
jgi:ribosomal protein L37E